MYGGLVVSTWYFFPWDRVISYDTAIVRINHFFDLILILENVKGMAVQNT